MKLIKISPKFQITIPKNYRHFCNSGWFSVTVENKVFILRQIEVKEAQTEKEIFDELANIADNETKFLD